MEKEEGSVKEEELIGLYEDLLEMTVGKMKRYLAKIWFLLFFLVLWRGER
jgi:hypothetical protein